MNNLPDGCSPNHPNFNENPGCSRCEFSCREWDDERLTALVNDELVCEKCLDEDDEPLNPPPGLAAAVGFLAPRYFQR
jgi:hypothetical protein